MVGEYYIEFQDKMLENTKNSICNSFHTTANKFLKTMKFPPQISAH